MAGPTKNGWEGRTFPEILQSIADEAQLEIGGDFPTSPDTRFGQLASIFANSHKSLWDLGQAVTDTQNRDTAEGVYLDYLAGISHLTRLKESGSTGQLLFTGRQSTLIPALFACKDLQNRNVLTKVPLTLNRANCYQSTFSVKILQDNVDYTLNVEGVEYTVNGGISPTISNILNNLKLTLDNGTTDFSSEVVDETIVLTYSSYNNNLTTTNSDSLNMDSVGSLVSSEAAVSGDASFDANTITRLVSSNINVDSVTNVTSFVKGRDEESDEDLRIRMSEREESTGTATKPSIESALSEVEGVSAALIIVNDTLVDDQTTGVPAKHFETFITGGDDNAIAEVLWKTKSLFGNSHGTINKTVIDDNGDTQSIRFSRNTGKFAHVRVTYTINDEEVFPSDGEDRMKASVVSFGNRMKQGEDLEPTKFYGPLYGIEGMFVGNIQVAVTDLATDTPVYQSSKIPVSPVESLEFSTDRVFITT